jgi:protoheme IX farnesyltransferase
MLLGCATGEFGIEAGTLFLIQFFGSFHIFGLLILYDDYEKAGFFMLPTGKKKIKAQRYRFYIPFGYLLLLPSVFVTRAFIYYASSGSSFFVGLWMLLRSKIV